MPKPQKKFLGPRSTQKWPDGPQKAQNDQKIKKVRKQKELTNWNLSVCMDKPQKRFQAFLQPQNSPIGP